MTPFDQAFSDVAELVQQFEANEARYLSTKYQEAEVRVDFLNKFWTALGWDVGHITQTNPREQEVKIEVGSDSISNRKVDYAFYLKPEFQRPVFLVEAKKPSADLDNPDFYFQTVRYGFNTSTTICVLTDFKEFHIIDCRRKPEKVAGLVKYAQLEKYTYTDYLDRTKFGYIYFLFSREAVEQGKLKAYWKGLKKPKGVAKQLRMIGDELAPPDDDFLADLDTYRKDLASIFKKTNTELGAEELTEIVQTVLDRIVFIRFLEDKLIEPDIIDTLLDKGSAWKKFLLESERLNKKYNGVVFKPKAVDKSNFNAPNDDKFAAICQAMSHQDSPYLLSYIPVEILGSIYERFLGKIVTLKGRGIAIEEKPEVRKAGGVYYTPKYIVDYIVENTVGKILNGRSAGVPPAPQPTQDAGGTPALQIHSRGYLPHYEQSGSTYFVTFRLADSLPKSILLQYKEELANAMRTANQALATQHKETYQEKILEYLDRGAGECYMNNSVIADIVEGAIKHFDGSRYNLYAWAIMPNHVHVLFRPMPNESLENILHSWKSFSSKKANKALDRAGQFWQEEYYDHLIRNEKEFQRILEYILNNPAASNLRNWKWVGFGDIYAEQPSRSAGILPAPVPTPALTTQPTQDAGGTPALHGHPDRSAGILPAPARDAGGTPALQQLSPKEVSKLKFADIACGSGSFLIAVFARVAHHLEEWYNANPDQAKKDKCRISPEGRWMLTLEQKRDILKNNIFGVDIDAQAVEVAQLSLFLKLLEEESIATTESAQTELKLADKTILPDLSKNILCGNSLVEYDIENLFPLEPEELEKIKPLDFKSAFKDIMSKGGFDAIVGNPPYGAIIERPIRHHLAKKYSLSIPEADSFILFLLRSLQLTKIGGLQGYIIPSTWLYMPTFNNTRKRILTDNIIDEIFWFRHPVFQKVTVETSTEIIKKTSPITDCTYSLTEVSSEPSTFNGRKQIISQKKVVSSKSVNLTSGGDDAGQLIFERLAESYKQLKEASLIVCGLTAYRLGKGKPKQTKQIVDNRAFDSNTKLDEHYRQYLMGRDFSKYQWQIEKRRWIKYGDWLAEPRYKAPFNDAQKIVIRQTADSIIAQLDTNQFLSLKNVHNLRIIDTAIDYSYLLGILNSKLITWWYRKLIPEVKRTFAEVKVINLEKLPIPNLDLTHPRDKERHDALVQLVDQMLDTKKRLSASTRDSEQEQLRRKCDYLDGEIDTLVYSLYDLTEDEIAVVEGGN